jgi:hypothetical protein
MTVRTSCMTVTFKRPFAVSGMDEMQPAGTYTIEIDEELLEGLSFPAYRRIATSVRLPAQPGSSIRGQVAQMDPGEVDAALRETSSDTTADRQST